MTQDTMNPKALTGHADLIGAELSEDRLRDLNARMSKAKSPFPIVTAAVSIHGTVGKYLFVTEGDYLFAEIIVKGHEYSPLEMTLPCKGSKVRESTNKRFHDLISSAAMYEELHDYFQAIADSRPDWVPYIEPTIALEFSEEPASAEKVAE